MNQTDDGHPERLVDRSARALRAIAVPEGPPAEVRRAVEALSPPTADDEHVNKSVLWRFAMNRTTHIAATLLQGDVIENLGVLQGEGECIHELASTLSQSLAHPAVDIEDALDQLVREGLLTHNASSKGVEWHWVGAR